MHSIEDIVSFIESDAWLMELLRAVQHLDEADSWIAAGTIRNPIWAKLHGAQFDPKDENDVDVIYFDTSHTSSAKELEYETVLKNLVPDAKWQVRNQARMHIKNRDTPYRNCSHALEYWAETPTAIGARLASSKVEILAPYGVEDLLALIVRQTPKFMHKRQIYEARITEKGWREKWPLLTII